MAAVKMGLWKDCYNGVYRKVKWMKYSVGSVLTKLQFEVLVYQGCGLLTKFSRTSRMDFKLAEPLRLAHKNYLNSILGILCLNAIYQ